MLSRLVLFSLPLLLAACVQAPEFPVEPEIEYVGVSKNSIKQGPTGQADTITFQLSFTDGDGDLSRDSADIFVTDQRLNQTFGLRIPDIPSEGTSNGISGDLMIEFTNRDICCIDFSTVPGRACFQDRDFPQDTVSFAIQIQDRAGNISNVVETDPIIVLCLN